MKKDMLPKTLDSVSKNLPKTTAAIDGVLSSIINVVDVLFAPFQIAKIYKDDVVSRFKDNLQRKVDKIPEEDLKDTTDLNIVGPTLEALKYTILEDELREMFENLLASSLNKKEDVFPSFVEIIKQLSSDEAKLLKKISQAGTDFPLIDLRFKLAQNKGYKEILTDFTDLSDDVCERPELISAYLNEFTKLGIITISNGTYLSEASLYDNLAKHQTIVQLKSNIDSKNFNGQYEIYRKKFTVTSYGKSFIKSCVLSK